jgi:plastocyanin domain-containing protein
VIPSLGIEEILDETGTRTIDLPPQTAGPLRFSCGMGMLRGQIVFE